MESKEESGGYVVIKLSHGEDVLECLRKAVSEHEITSGFVLMGVGMFSHVRIGYYTKEGYESQDLDEPHELVDLHGSISTKGEVVIHLHCGLANSNHEMVGGHLFRAKACMVNEILVKKLSDVELDRKFNTETGLKELTVG